MNTKIIALLVAGAVAVGVGYMIFKGENRDPLPGEVTSEPKETFGSLSSLIGGESLYCTFKGTDDGVESEGEFWHAAGQYRVEAVSTMENGVYETYIIHDGTDMYIWSDTPDGLVAITMTDDGENLEVPGGESETAPNIEEEVEYKCSGWSPDGSRFSPPADIEFLDLESLMKDLPVLPG